MTICIGVLCSDGGVIGTDRELTHIDARGFDVASQPFDKLFLDGTRAAYGFAGDVSAAQQTWARLSDPEIVRHPAPSLSALSDSVRRALHAVPNAYTDHCKAQEIPADHGLIKDYSRESVGEGFLLSSTITGGRRAPALISWSGAFHVHALSEQVYVRSFGDGSLAGTPTALALANAVFPERLPTVAEAMILAFWTIRHVIGTRAGGHSGGDVALAVLERVPAGFEVRRADRIDFEHLRVKYDSLQDALRREFRRGLSGDEPVESDELPPG